MIKTLTTNKIDDDNLSKTPCLDQQGDYIIRNTDMILKEQYLNNTLVRAFYNFMKDVNLEF
ncbi:hypothetical protein [Staphylococcus shinii]|uniref:hypothetical protein n=1 Tax=Staphylococcus shinii TaxID=2912228 RepID=UPI00298F3C09|nr:hypothetical protein [Staphylococcus shinii]MDW8567064.1 hypothetical protein [Staphylococcus shinii]